MQLLFSRKYILCCRVYFIVYNSYVWPSIYRTSLRSRAVPAHTIAVFNAKGGVGKTSTSYNLAVGLHRFHDLRVLLVDIDPQGHAGVALGVNIADLQHRIDEVLQEKASIKDTIVKTEAGVDVVPSNILLAEAEIPISGLHGREVLLRRAVSSIINEYDVILTDCPPNVGILSVNALMAAKQVLVPVDMSYLGLLGIPVIERILGLIQNRLEHPIEILGVLATRYDSRLNIAKDVLDSLEKHFGDRLFETVIPETVKIREAPSFQASIFDHAPGSSGAMAYQQLTEEVMKRVR
ncbi:ParA family protein [Leptolyngbya sp. FACHB-60]|nr:ParA family protein [Leptolyngbya sp. FACHB-60]MBD1919465.1 ParA family protein [Phormidium sp. FACHB-77]MBD2054317.1 ParA family protein [Leptolyngbya sp. FACHB-60]